MGITKRKKTRMISMHRLAEKLGKSYSAVRQRLAESQGGEIRPDKVKDYGYYRMNLFGGRTVRALKLYLKDHPINERGRPKLKKKGKQKP